MCRLKNGLSLLLLLSLSFFFFASPCWAMDTGMSGDALTNILLLSTEAKGLLAQLKVDSISKDQSLMQLGQKLNYYEQKIASFDQRYAILESKLNNSEKLRLEIQTESQDLKASLTELSRLYEDYKKKAERKIKLLVFERNICIGIASLALFF